MRGAEGPAGVDPVRVGQRDTAGLRTAEVELVDLGPSEGIAELALSDAPEGVAPLHRVRDRRRGWLDWSKCRRPIDGRVDGGRRSRGDRRRVAGEDGVADDQRGGWSARRQADAGPCCWRRGVGGLGGEREAGDDDGGEESPGEGLEGSGDGEPAGAPAGERGGNLNGERCDEDDPGEPDDHGEGVDEGLGGDALTVEGAAELCGRGEVVWQRPADEVPERPGGPGDEADKHGEGGDPLEEVDDLGHGLACSAVAVPDPLTVRWSMPTRESSWAGWLMVTVTVTWSPSTATVPVRPDWAR